jgi:hypothetical protein
LSIRKAIVTKKLLCSFAIGYYVGIIVTNAGQQRVITDNNWYIPDDRTNQEIYQPPIISLIHDISWMKKIGCSGLFLK